MKKSLLIPLLFFVVHLHAQSFEGTINWSVKYEIADPAKRAEMEKSMKAMSDPANQEKMKKMQEQMNTPEMKAMMDANPQLKARMEGTMKLMQGNGGNTLFPQSLVVKIKGNSSITRMEGGVVAMETLYNGDKKQAYLLNRASKTYTAVKQDEAAGHRMDSSKRTVTKTGETMKILNYTCTRYLVSYVNRDTINQAFWTTTEIKGLDLSILARQKMGNSSQPMFYKEIAGVPLRMEISTKQMNLVMEVTDIKKESLPATDFVLPADFKEVQGFLP